MSKEKVELDNQAPTVYWFAVEAQIEGLLLGKVLTIIDASYQDPIQREAVKSLIKDKFHSQVDWLLDRQKSKAQGSVLSEES